MVIDLKKCIGCYGCQIFCKAENATPPKVLWSYLLFSESGGYPNVRKDPLPLLCMQCGDPVCVNVCPTRASTKRADGIVIVDSTKCLGCGSCVVACPYRARTLSSPIDKGYFPEQPLTPYEEVGYQKHTAGVATKCNFCLPRIQKGLEPVCVVNCMTHARYFGDLDDPNSEVSYFILEQKGVQLNPELGTNPSVYYLLPDR